MNIDEEVIEYEFKKKQNENKNNSEFDILNEKLNSCLQKIQLRN